MPCSRLSVKIYFTIQIFEQLLWVKKEQRLNTSFCDSTNSYFMIHEEPESERVFACVCNGLFAPWDLHKAMQTMDWQMVGPAATHSSDVSPARAVTVMHLLARCHRTWQGKEDIPHLTTEVRDHKIVSLILCLHNHTTEGATILGIYIPEKYPDLPSS